MKYILIILFLVLVMGCQDTFLGNDPDNTPRNNFESLWRTLDQKYSYFSYKNVDWNKVYETYSPMINDTMSDVRLFNVLFNMLSELKDSHVNLFAPFNSSRYEKVFTSSPQNFDIKTVYTYYLKRDYWITGPLLHQIIANGKVGYIYYPSFTESVSSDNIDLIINRFKDKEGIILDVRNNGGGEVTNVFTLVSRFADIKRHVYTSYIKTGPGHEDFSGPNKVYISSAPVNFTKPVCVLTNRNSYSATSFFVLAMREFPKVTIIGDTTGGGLGAPTGAELPNGWSFRFSGSKTISVDGQNYEDGIPPDIPLNLSSSEVKRGHDNIIDKAISVIMTGQ